MILNSLETGWLTDGLQLNSVCRSWSSQLKLIAKEYFSCSCKAEENYIGVWLPSEAKMRYVLFVLVSLSLLLLLIL